MDASIEGALSQINRSWKAFEHKGKRMTKTQVKTLLEYGIKKGYTTTNQLSDKEVDGIINGVKQKEQPLLIFN